MNLLKSLTFIISLILFSNKSYSQTTMNIYLNDSSVVHIPIDLIDSITFSNTNDLLIATVITNPIDSLTFIGGIFSGNVISHVGEIPNIYKGMCIDTVPNPMIGNLNSYVLDGGIGTGAFSISMYENDLFYPNRTYYMKAFVRNITGTFCLYGNEYSFTTPATSGLTQSTPGNGVIDIDGNIYTSIILGNSQEWLAENLKVKRFTNGDSITFIEDGGEWMLTSQTGIPLWYYSNSDSLTNQQNGKLYNWYAVNDSRNLCPSGWKIPNNQDWDLLIDYLGGQSMASSKLKLVGNEHWLLYNQDATNEIGFNAYPSGLMPFSQTSNFGDSAFWWSSSNFSSENAWMYQIRDLGSQVDIDPYYKWTGNSVRCIKE